MRRPSQPSHRRARTDARAGRPVSRFHERRRHPRDADDVRAKALVGYRRHLDQVPVSGDELFETMQGSGHVGECRCGQLKLGTR